MKMFLDLKEVRQSAAVRFQNALKKEKEKRERLERAGQELLNRPKKSEEPKQGVTKEEVELEEAAQGHTIEAHGIRGMKGTPWRKTFKSHEHLNDWAEKNDSVEVHGTRDLEKAKKVQEESSPQIKIHRVGLTVTDPNHPMVSKRKETIQKTVRMPGEDREKAINSAIAHYKRKGFKIHDHHYIGTVNEVNDYFKRRQREKDVDAGKPVSRQPKNPQNDYFARRRKDPDAPTNKKAPRYEEVDLDEAANPAQQAAIAIAMKKAGKKPKHMKEEQSMTEESNAYEKSEENKRSADAAKNQGDMFAHHLHMADYHDNLSQWHSERGRHNIADKHAEKSEEYHKKAMKLKEDVDQIKESLEDTLAAFNKNRPAHAQAKIDTRSVAQRKADTDKMLAAKKKPTPTPVKTKPASMDDVHKQIAKSYASHKPGQYVGDSVEMKDIPGMVRENINAAVDEGIARLISKSIKNVTARKPTPQEKADIRLNIDNK